MKQNFSIQKVLPEDISILLAMNNDAAPAVNELDLQKFTDLCQNSEFLVKGVKNGTICGFLMVLPSGLKYESLNYRWFSEHYGSFLYIDRIVVDPAYAHSGLGSALYEELFTFARRSGWSRINCEVNIRPMNAVSIGFHQKSGFAPLGTQDTEGGKKTVQFYTKTVNP